MPYMERVVLPSGRFTASVDGERYLLNYDDRVIYENGKRTVKGKSSPYTFRSIEQLRYDFERDVQSL